ncbi:hypothetical protein GLOTRDRAFT_139536 [Gloeophyllum trabeum ATCC 11539]|uniref:Uncharacterized protein n=1 Tax=Gloeophyllum trabeum (strain ATCC 11539 / FP-39264 / Madison 617) TaxID=670483 RepID=S7RN40_GLOTA|nr:uncharacterized protein GLOTRDRAFT_139536 [Gloeophyllum trabeum ATCC 11539]EPQ54159.1 hypothetical protein GLOTRDRAFT_139536 [Gloeophyllum trabeum ATCC 11539]
MSDEDWATSSGSSDPFFAIMERGMEVLEDQHMSSCAVGDFDTASDGEQERPEDTYRSPSPSLEDIPTLGVSGPSRKLSLAEILRDRPQGRCDREEQQKTSSTGPFAVMSSGHRFLAYGADTSRASGFRLLPGLSGTSIAGDVGFSTFMLNGLERPRTSTPAGVPDPAAIKRYLAGVRATRRSSKLGRHFPAAARKEEINEPRDILWQTWLKAIEKREAVRRGQEMYEPSREAAGKSAGLRRNRAKVDEPQMLLRAKTLRKRAEAYSPGKPVVRTEQPGLALAGPIGHTGTKRKSRLPSDGEGRAHKKRKTVSFVDPEECADGPVVESILPSGYREVFTDDTMFRGHFNRNGTCAQQ